MQTILLHQQPVHRVAVTLDITQGGIEVVSGIIRHRVAVQDHQRVGDVFNGPLQSIFAVIIALGKIALRRHPHQQSVVVQLFQEYPQRAVRLAVGDHVHGPAQGFAGLRSEFVQLVGDDRQHRLLGGHQFLPEHPDELFGAADHIRHQRLGVRVVDFGLRPIHGLRQLPFKCVEPGQHLVIAGLVVIGHPQPHAVQGVESVGGDGSIRRQIAGNGVHVGIEGLELAHGDHDHQSKGQQNEHRNDQKLAGHAQLTFDDGK